MTFKEKQAPTDCIFSWLPASLFFFLYQFLLVSESEETQIISTFCTLSTNDLRWGQLSILQDLSFLACSHW